MAHPVHSDLEREQALKLGVKLADVYVLFDLLEDAHHQLKELTKLREQIENIVDEKNYLSDEDLLDLVEEAVSDAEHLKKHVEPHVESLEARSREAEEVAILAHAFAYLKAVNFNTSKLSKEGVKAFDEANRLLEEP